MFRSLPKTVRACAAFDLVVTALLIWPGTAVELIELLYRVNTLFGGDATSPGFQSIHLLFVSLAGVLGVLWALARILDPRPLLAGLDGIGRLVVAALILLAVFGGKAPAILLLFVLTELAGAVAQAVALAISAPRASVVDTEVAPSDVPRL